MNVSSLPRTKRAALAIATGVSCLVLSGCGAGLAGGASAASGGDSGVDPESPRLLLSESTPELSMTEFREPLEPNDVPEGAIPAQPSDEIILQFSDPIDRTLGGARFDVSLKRPGAEYVPVAGVSASSTSPRGVTVKLPTDTLHNSLYRVVVSGLMGSSGLAQVPRTTTYFVVRDGEWKEPEIITLGGAVAGGVLLTDDLNAYATVEAISGLQAGGLVWTVSLLSARFGSPWQFPATLFARVTAGDEAGVQLATGALLLEGDVGVVTLLEGDGNEPNASTVSGIFRAPVGLQVGAPFPDSVQGLHFGPRVDVTSLNDTRGRVDLPGPPELGGSHFSYQGEILVSGSHVATSFWGLSNPQVLSGLTGDRFETQRVYANDVMAPPFQGDPDLVEWADWGAARRLSPDGEEHNSWPLIAQFDSGEAVAVWWSAASTDGIFADAVERYWLAQWIPGTGWTQAVDVTPTGAAGTLPPLSDLHALERGGGAQTVLLFANAATGPVAREYDVTQGIWTAPTSPSGLYDVVHAPSGADYVTLDGSSVPYRKLKGSVGTMTPKATDMGAQEFLVRWVDRSSPGGVATTSLRVCAYDSDPASAQSPWGTQVVDLSPITQLDSNDPARANIDLSVDQNGWATLVWRRRGDPLDPTSPFRVFAQRASIPLAGPQGLLTAPTPPVAISPEGVEIFSPAISNTHSSGAFSLFWAHRIPNVGTQFPVGSGLRRFQ